MGTVRVFGRDYDKDELAWMGILDLPELVDEAIAEEYLSADDPRDFEATLDQWWSEFICDFSL